MDMSAAANIPKNAITPFKTGTLFLGSAEYVAVEIITDMMLRMLIGSFVRGVGRKSIYELAVIHTLSLPIIGGGAGGFEDFHDEKSDFKNQVMDGAKGIVGMFLAQYVYGVSCNGFYIPRPNLTDAMVSAAAKTLSRPLNVAISSYAPAQLKQAINAVTQVIRAQQKASYLGDAKTKLG